MPTDLEIANAATLEPIEAIAWKLGISSTEIMPMGRNVAKITWDALKSRMNKPQGSLVLVTSVNPTPFGEGKTVTTIGLTQALCRIGQSATCVIRAFNGPCVWHQRWCCRWRLLTSFANGRHQSPFHW